MARELRVVNSTNKAMYAILVASYGEHVGQWWNNSTLAFEEFIAGNWSLYAITMTEPNGTGYYLGNMPTTMPQRLHHVDVLFFQQSGGSPAVLDSKVRGYLYARTGGDWLAGQQIVV